MTSNEVFLDIKTYNIGKDDFYGKKGRHLLYKRRHLQEPASSVAGTGGSDEKHRTEPHRGRDTCTRPRQVFLPESVGRAAANFAMCSVAESKEKHGVWDPMPELATNSPYVHSKVDSSTLTMGNPMSESTLSTSQGLWIWPLSTSSKQKVQRRGSLSMRGLAFTR
jgi:hypothetical protein